MRRVLSIFMILLLLVSMTAVAEETITTTSISVQDQQANALNALNILRGDGTGFKLDQQLTRAEAATFIVRMVGMDATVMSDRGNYLNFNFSDVASYDWYAPYVGYCYEIGVIGGFADGTFKPLDYVSEKAFLKMLMTAMGYVYNEDFTWDEVFSQAYEIGLVADSSYAELTQDNYEYTRGEVVSALFTTLSTEKKGSEESLLKYFLDSEVITKKEASEFGFEVDSVVTAISSVDMVNESKIVVTFNEAVSVVDIDDWIIINAEGSTVAANIESLVLSEDETAYELELTSSLLPDRSYKVMVNNIQDKNENEADLLSYDFTYERPADYTSNYFMIQSVQVLSEDQIEVFFTHPINENILYPGYFKILENDVTITGNSSTTISVTQNPEVSNGVVLSLDIVSLEQDHEYVLEINGNATSAYTVGMNDGDGDYIRFTAEYGDSQQGFVLENITTTSTTTVELDFSSQVNEVIAEQVFSYYVTSYNDAPIQITSAEVIDTQDKVKLTLATPMVLDKTYHIMINNINDATKAYSIQEQSYDYLVEVAEVSDFEITKVTAIDAAVISLTLTRPLDSDSATDVDNYLVVGTNYSKKPEVVFYDKMLDPLEVILYMPRYSGMTKGLNYEVKILSGTEDENGHKQVTTKVAQFTATSSIVTGVFIKEAVVVGENTVKLTFTKEIEKEVPNVLNTNYFLVFDEDGNSYKKVPLSANYIDPLTIILKFDNLDKDLSYQAGFNELTDYAGNKIANPTGVYLKSVIWR